MMKSHRWTPSNRQTNTKGSPNKQTQNLVQKSSQKESIFKLVSHITQTKQKHEPRSRSTWTSTVLASRSRNRAYMQFLKEKHDQRTTKQGEGRRWCGGWNSSHHHPSRLHWRRKALDLRGWSKCDWWKG